MRSYDSQTMTFSKSRFKKLLSRLKKEFKASNSGSSSSAPVETTDPIDQLVVGFLMWNSTPEQAASRFAHLQSHFVDFNDLRVALPEEIARALASDSGSSEPDHDAYDRSARIRACLSEIFTRESELSLGSLRESPEGEVREYLSTLPGMVPYVIGRIMLFAFRHPLLPVDEQLVRALVTEEVLDLTNNDDLSESAAVGGALAAESIRDLQQALTAALPADGLEEHYRCLQAWSSAGA